MTSFLRKLRWGKTPTTMTSLKTLLFVCALGNLHSNDCLSRYTNRNCSFQSRNIIVTWGNSWKICSDCTVMNLMKGCAVIFVLMPCKWTLTAQTFFSSFLMWQPVAIHTQTKLVGVGLAYKLETSMVHTMYRCWHSNMDAMSSEDLIHAQRMVFHHSLSFITSMALKCAVDLGIPEAIHLHGGSATIADIVAGIGLHESRLPYVKRLMNVLAVSGVFAYLHMFYKCNPRARNSYFFQLWCGHVNRIIYTVFDLAP